MEKLPPRLDGCTLVGLRNGNGFDFFIECDDPRDAAPMLLATNIKGSLLGPTTAPPIVSQLERAEVEIKG